MAPRLGADRPTDDPCDPFRVEDIARVVPGYQAASVVEGHADPLCSLADAEPFPDESPQRVRQSALRLLA